MRRRKIIPHRKGKDTSHKQFFQRTFGNLTQENQPSPVRGEMALWSAVITQALMDASSRSPKTEARYEKDVATRWLTEKSDDFIRVCDYAGICPGYARRMAKRALARGCIWRAETKKRSRRKRRKLLQPSAGEDLTHRAA